MCVCSPAGQTAYEDSPFSAAFIEALDKMNLSLSGVFQYILNSRHIQCICIHCTCVRLYNNNVHVYYHNSLCVAEMSSGMYGTRPKHSGGMKDDKITFHDKIMRDDVKRLDDVEKVYDQWQKTQCRHCMSFFGDSLIHSSLFCISHPLPLSLPPSLSLPLSLPPSLHCSALPDTVTLADSQLRSLSDMLSARLRFRTDFTNVLTILVDVSPKQDNLTVSLNLDADSLVCIQCTIYMYMYFNLVSEAVLYAE